MITAEGWRYYEEKGYWLVRRLFDASELEVWSKRFLAVVNEEVDPAEGMLVMRDVMVAKGAVAPEAPAEAIAKIQDFQNDPVLFDDRLLVARDGEPLAEPVRDLDLDLSVFVRARQAAG